MHRGVISFLIGIFILAGSIYSLTVEKISLEELSQEADLIIYGRVISSESEWENQSPGNINTYSEISIFEKIKGEAENSIIIKQMGGTIGEFSDIVSGTPILKPEEEFVFFLVNHNNEWLIHSIALGAYRIFQNERGTNLIYNEFLVGPADNRSISLITPQAEGEEVYELNDFLSSVRSFVTE
jgi:hypothetical protein